MPYYTTTFSTVVNSTTPGFSTPFSLSWIGGKATTASVSFGSSTASADTVIQYSLDDIMRVSSSLVTWVPVTSSAGSSTIGHYASSVYFDTGFTVSFLNPIASIRFGSTAMSSGTVSFKVVQGE